MINPVCRQLITEQLMCINSGCRADRRIICTGKTLSEFKEGRE